MCIHCSTSNPDYSQNTGQTLTQTHTKNIYREPYKYNMTISYSQVHIDSFVYDCTHWMVYAASSQEEQEGWQDFNTTKGTRGEKTLRLIQTLLWVMNSTLSLLFPDYIDCCWRHGIKCCSINITLAVGTHTYSGELSGCSWRYGHSLGHRCTLWDTGDRRMKLNDFPCVLITSIVLL